MQPSSPLPSGKRQEGRAFSLFHQHHIPLLLVFPVFYCYTAPVFPTLRGFVKMYKEGESMARIKTLAGAVLLVTTVTVPTAYASDVEDVVEVASDIVELIREVSGARHRYEDDRSESYRREWLEQRDRLEELRTDEISRLAGVSRGAIRDMRSRDYGWDAICDIYHINPKRIGLKAHQGRDDDDD